MFQYMEHLIVDKILIVPVKSSHFFNTSTEKSYEFCFFFLPSYTKHRESHALTLSFSSPLLYVISASYQTRPKLSLVLWKKTYEQNI